MTSGTVITVNTADGGLLAMVVATSIQSHNKGNTYKPPNDEKEVEMEEISVMSEEVGYTVAVQSIFVPELP